MRRAKDVPKIELPKLAELEDVTKRRRTINPAPRQAPIRTALPQGMRKQVRVVGPGEPPAGFLTPWNSRSEWYCYWALWKVLKEEGDVRRPPFIGGQRFGYQTVVNGGRSSLGGTIVDFVVYLRGQDIGIYIQTDRYHLAADARTKTLDHLRMLAAARYMRVIPIFETDLIADPTGEQACRTVVNALGGRSQINPVTSGTYRPTRMGRLFGTRRR